MKLTKRKGFNFFRSYYDVYNELETDKDKVAFLNALLDSPKLPATPLKSESILRQSPGSLDRDK